MNIKLYPGDVFCTANPWLLGRMILWTERMWSHDNEALYGHAGIVDSPEGATFEALWRIRHAQLSDYSGKAIVIARPRAVQGKKDERLAMLKERFEGKRYPLHRLAMHILPPVAKLGTGNFVVCSELVAAYLWMLGLRHKQYLGTNPDTLADEWRQGYCCDVLFEGIFEQQTT